MVQINNLLKFAGASYHPNRRTARHERERIDRDRERLHARERELAAYDLNDDEILSNRGHLNTIPATTHIRHTNEDSDYLRERDDRYPLTTQSSRTIDDYPHGGGRDRRVLNAM